MRRSIKGTYVGPVLINNALTLNFVVDSGAADVSVHADVVMTLLRPGTVKRQILWHIRQITGRLGTMLDLIEDVVGNGLQPADAHVASME